VKADFALDEGGEWAELFDNQGRERE